MTQTTRKTVNYTRMDQGTVEDYAFARELNVPFTAATADRVLAYLPLLVNSLMDGQIDRYQHSLQTATRALPRRRVRRDRRCSLVTRSG